VIAVEQGAGGSLQLRLDPDESAVLGHIVDEMLTLLHSQAADDPVTKRLFPDAYESPEDAAAYNELVSDQLMAAKISALETVRKDLENGADLVLERDSVEMWLTALTDLRLALGTRLDMTEEKMAMDLDPRDPEASSYAILHWLGWLQESLVEAINP
jgi:uncharacterized protein DUF2017